MKAKNVVHSSVQEQAGTPLCEKHSSQESHKCVKARSVVQVTEPELICPPLSGAPMLNTSEVPKNEDESDWTLPRSTVKPSDAPNRIRYESNALWLPSARSILVA